MTVADLIDALSLCDPDTPVRLLTPATRADDTDPQRGVGDTLARVDTAPHWCLLVPSLEDLR